MVECGDWVTAGRRVAAACLPATAFATASTAIDPGARMDLDDIFTHSASLARDGVLVLRAAHAAAADATRPPAPDDAPGEPVVAWCNPAFEEMTGRCLAELQGRSLASLAAAGEAREAALQSRLEVLLARERALQARLERLRVREQALQARLETLSAREEALQDEKLGLAGIAAVAEHARDLITITDTQFRVLWANPAYLQKTGHSAAAVRGVRLCDLLHKTGRRYSSEQIARNAILQGSVRDGEVCNVDGEGREFWTDVRVSVLRDARGRPERFIIVERDVTEQRAQRLALERSRRELADALVHDHLTGLFNRRGFEDRMARLAERAAHSGAGVAVFHLDLDRFKQINDTFGHAAGDQVLEQVTQRLRARLGAGSFAARIGGDEFVIAMELHDPAVDLDLFANRLITDVGRPVRLEHADCRFGVSIGYATAHAPPFDVDALLVQSDIALYRAKANGRNCAQGFTESLARETRSRKRLADELGSSLEKGLFFPVYQPQVCAVTGRVVGVEALLRWAHPQRGVLTPAHFLLLARELNLEPVLESFMLAQVLDDLLVMQQAGCAIPRISVNVSSHRLKSSTLIDEVKYFSLPPGMFSFELLESTFLDDTDDRVLHTLAGLREMGIAIEIDDFGTGHASIMGLLRVAPDRVKTDRSLTALAAGCERYRRLFEHIVGIGHTLGIEVTVEGVETAEQAALAREMGCSVLQGYYFARPMALDALVARYGATAREEDDPAPTEAAAASAAASSAAPPGPAARHPLRPSARGGRAGDAGACR